MPRDDYNYDPKKHFNPKVQEELNREQIEELMTQSAKKAVEQVLRERGMLNPYEQPPVDPSDPRPYTTEEAVNNLMEGVVHNVRYWQTQPNCGTMEDRVEGVAFSILSMLDGSQIDIPPFSLMPDVDEDYVDDCIENGDNYYNPDTVISTMLHERFHPKMHEMYPDTAPSGRHNELDPQQMRERFVGVVDKIVSTYGNSDHEKDKACNWVAQEILMLIDGQSVTNMPPFMLFASPSKEFNERQVKTGQPTWGNHIPLNRQAPTYGVTESLTDAYHSIRARSAQAKRDLFK